MNLPALCRLQTVRTQDESLWKPPRCRGRGSSVTRSSPRSGPRRPRLASDLGSAAQPEACRRPAGSAAMRLPGAPVLSGSAQRGRAAGQTRLSCPCLPGTTRRTSVHFRKLRDSCVCKGWTCGRPGAPPSSAGTGLSGCPAHLLREPRGLWPFVTRPRQCKRPVPRPARGDFRPLTSASGPVCATRGGAPRGDTAARSSILLFLSLGGSHGSASGRRVPHSHSGLSNLLSLPQACRVAVPSVLPAGVCQLWPRASWACSPGRGCLPASLLQADHPPLSLPRSSPGQHLLPPAFRAGRLCTPLSDCWPRANSCPCLSLGTAGGAPQAPGCWCSGLRGEETPKGPSC